MTMLAAICCSPLQGYRSDGHDRRGPRERTHRAGHGAHDRVVRADVPCPGDPMRPDECFAELLRRVRGVTLDAMAHQALPYPALVRDMALERRETADPLCQVAFQLRRRGRGRLILRRLSVDRYDVGAPSSAYDLTMTVEDDGESMICLVSFDPAVIDVDTVQHFLRRYELLLTSGLDALDGKVADLDVLDAGEERMMLDEWGGRARAESVPRTTVHALVEGCARAHPDAVAVEEGESVLTYGELNARRTAWHSCCMCTGSPPFCRGTAHGPFCRHYRGDAGDPESGGDIPATGSRLSPCQAVRHDQGGPPRSCPGGIRAA